MLNEMMLLRRTLGELGISTKSRHPDLAMLGKGSPLLRVFLDAAGSVTTVEVVGKDVAANYWTFRDGKQNSFPRISFKPALRAGATGDDLQALTNRRKSLEQRRDAFLDLRVKLPITIARVIPWITTGHRQRIAERGIDAEKGRNTEAKLFNTLVNAFQKTQDEPLLIEIENTVVSELMTNPTEDLLALACRLSFLDGAKSAKPVDACDLLFDYEDMRTFGRAAAPNMVSILSDALSSTDKAASTGVCALTGQPSLIEDDKFPEASLGPLGPTYLHTRNCDIPSAHRYGASGPASMPVGRALASELQAAAEELTSPARKGKTWDSIPSEKPKQSDLLVCYLPSLPNLELASAFAANEAEFEKLGERIAKLAEGTNVYIPPNSRIEVAVIRKIDKANKKTIHSCSLTRKGLEDAAEAWTTACHNVPEVVLFVPNKKGEAASRIGPPTLSPGRIVALSRKLYVNEGTKALDASGLSFAEAFSLVMGGKSNSNTKRRSILRLALSRFAPLLIGIGHVQSRLIKSPSKPDMNDFSPDSRRDALAAVSLIGALLFQLDIKITKDMNTQAYLLGQLLAGSDVLHRGYCLHVRGGKLPPKLIGNAAINTAAKNPTAAMEQLRSRWGPYGGWASKMLAETDFQQWLTANEANEKEKRRIYDIRAGVFAPTKLRELAEQLHAAGEWPRIDDAFRAQLFLGYLAGLPRNQEKPPSVSTTTPTTANS
jgi:hypothetical protein